MRQLDIFLSTSSFKGYIPGWWGSDFDGLVRSEEELREWIEEGEIKRLTSHREFSLSEEEPGITRADSLDLTKLEVFYHVARLRSFSEAAE